MAKDRLVIVISIYMLNNPEAYKKTDPWRAYILRIRERLDKKIYYLKKHKTALGVSNSSVEVWQRGKSTDVSK